MSFFDTVLLVLAAIAAIASVCNLLLNVHYRRSAAAFPATEPRHPFVTYETRAEPPVATRVIRGGRVPEWWGEPRQWP